MSNITEKSYLRHEAHHIVIVAPMGNAASLQSGSTYHYLFGINDKESSPSTLAQVRKTHLCTVGWLGLGQIFDENRKALLKKLYSTK